MKKFFYFLTMVITFTMFSTNVNADSYLYLHYCYPDCTEEEYEKVNETLYLDETCLYNTCFYRDKDKKTSISKWSYQFPTYNGYKFLGFFVKGFGGKWEKVFYNFSNTDNVPSISNGDYYTKNKDTHLYGRWEKIEDNTTTDISSVKEENHTSNIYNLNGSKINGTPKNGIYILNGKKIFFK